MASIPCSSNGFSHQHSATTTTASPPRNIHGSTCSAALDWLRQVSLIFILGDINPSGKMLYDSPAFDAGIRSTHATSQDLLNHCKIGHSFPQSVGHKLKPCGGRS